MLTAKLIKQHRKHRKQLIEFLSRSIEERRERYQNAARSPTLSVDETQLYFDKTQMNLETILADSDMKKHFHEFLEECYASESLDFYDACDNLLLAVQFVSEKDKCELYAKLIDEFVESNGKKQVNLPSSLASQLILKKNSSGVDSTTIRLIELAKKEIASLMNMNFVVKFLSVLDDFSSVGDSDTDEEKEDEEKVRRKFEIRKIGEILQL